MKNKKNNFANKDVTKKKEYNFKPGISGNPSGRPKDELGILIRSKKDLPQKLFNKVLKLTDYKNKLVALKAIEYLSDRGWGKPAQILDVGGSGLNINISRDKE